ncbi:hypothetical protein CSAL01_10608 [Colletotrichum salicis]|uniref:Uncharacterized protein n=1 Tax=Colletotrichum salicis TaxID=1209931 RepID=A0A135V1I8_9PEZI|nr:hypothetical protein CSAL01_10608 [Colletotrichum salicis]
MSSQDTSESLSDNQIDNNITRFTCESNSSTIENTVSPPKSVPEEVLWVTAVPERQDGPVTNTKDTHSQTAHSDELETTSQAKSDGLDVVKDEDKGRSQDEEDRAVETDNEDGGYGSSGSSASDPMSDVDPDTRQRIGKKRLQQHAQHLAITEQRIRVLEQRLNAIEKLTPRPAEAKLENIPAKPQLNFIEWTQFKATKCRKETDERHAIDVLVV